MTQNYSAVIRQSGEWWIGCIKEVRGVHHRSLSENAQKKCTLRLD